MGAVKRNTLSVLFIIKKAKLLKNGEAPVCMRITVNKRAAEVMIKRSISVELWNQKKGMLQGKRPGSHRTEPLYQYGSCQSIADTP